MSVGLIPPNTLINFIGGISLTGNHNRAVGQKDSPLATLDDDSI